MKDAVASVAAIIERELRTLRAEIEACSDERDLWLVATGIAHSPAGLHTPQCAAAFAGR